MQVFCFSHFQMNSNFPLLFSNTFNDKLMAFVDKGFNPDPCIEYYTFFGGLAENSNVMLFKS